MRDSVERKYEKSGIVKKEYVAVYDSPLGEIQLRSDGECLTGLDFKGQKHFVECQPGAEEGRELPILRETCLWLDIYFKGQEPDFMPKVQLEGSAFQLEVWEILKKIPYGQTVTYGEIAKELAEKRGIARMSAQAVGGAVGRNPISIIVPCHRVVGGDGSLTGYGGGIWRKEALLKVEGGY